MKKKLLILVSVMFAIFAFTMDEDRPGYRWNPHSEQWVDIDECSELQPCLSGAICHNFPGGYTCIFTDGGPVTDNCMGIQCNNRCIGDSGVNWGKAIAFGTVCDDCDLIHW